jgi:hypothetical protein
LHSRCSDFTVASTPPLLTVNSPNVQNSISKTRKCFGGYFSFSATISPKVYTFHCSCLCRRGKKTGWTHPSVSLSVSALLSLFLPRCILLYMLDSISVVSSQNKPRNQANAVRDLPWPPTANRPAEEGTRLSRLSVTRCPVFVSAFVLHRTCKMHAARLVAVTYYPAFAGVRFGRYLK